VGCPAALFLFHVLPVIYIYMCVYLCINKCSTKALGIWLAAVPAGIYYEYYVIGCSLLVLEATWSVRPIIIYIIYTVLPARLMAALLLLSLPCSRKYFLLIPLPHFNNQYLHVACSPSHINTSTAICTAPSTPTLYSSNTHRENFLPSLYGIIIYQVSPVL
jgi:hypothetical protein